MTVISELFGKPRAIIAMAHFPPMPGQPRYDATGGVRALFEAVKRDVEVLVDSGIDGLIFCNEGDRPYRTTAGPEVPAVMASVITELRDQLTIPYGVDILWDPKAAIGLAHAVGARYVREVFTGSYAGDFGIWNTDPAGALAYRRQIGADGVKLFFNVTAEFAAPIAPREIGLTARSAVFSSLADAICVSGVVTGTGAALEDLRAAKDAVGPETAVIANTGVRPDTVARMLDVVDACIVGTSLKRDACTWNEIDPRRVAALVEAAAEGGQWMPTSRGRDSMVGRAEERR